MVTLSDASGMAQVASVACATVLGIYGVWRKIDQRQTETHIDTLRINDKLDYMEQQFRIQFGGNGGGMREAINTIADRQERIDLRVTKIGDDVANLRGKFDQHITETDK